MASGKADSEINEVDDDSISKHPLRPTDEDADEYDFCTITASPSVDSLPSSILSNLKIDDDFSMDTRDLFVKVDNPEKHSSAMESYITFRIVTKTIRSDYDSHEYSVRRRYNDFMWLRQKLEEMYPSHLVPPLPEKHSMQRLSRFNPDFIKARMMALNKFLNRVADHPVLSFDESMKVFLTAKAFEFSAHRKLATGFIGRMSESFHNLAATYMIKSRSPEFDHLNDYMYKLNDKLGNLERIASRVNKEQVDYATELNEMHPVFTLWSSSETALNSALAAVAAAVESCAAAQMEVLNSFEERYQQPLHEYMLYTEAIKEVLKRRDAIQIEYELTLEELQKRKAERDQVKSSEQTFTLTSLFGKDPQLVKQEKQERLEKIIEVLVRQTEENNDKAECANSDLKADMERWNVTKQKDFKKLFINLADQQIQYYQKCLSAWEESIPAIKEISIEDEDEANYGQHSL